MNTLVIYSSKSGYVENYAKWIKEELNCDICSTKEASLEVMQSYDTIIYGGGLYAVGINGIQIIKDNLSALSNKNIVVFMSGASPYREGIIDEVMDSNFTKDERINVRAFYLRGGFDYNRLGFVDKLLMNLLKAKIKFKKEAKRTPDERGMLAAYEMPMDFTSKEKIEPILSYVRNLPN